MTQLFDTETYEDATLATTTGELSRHLHSIPAGDDLGLADRTTQWRLDPQTIETGRKGIQAARQALQDAAKAKKGDKAETAKINRRAA